jgi:hypothetical protein
LGHILSSSVFNSLWPACLFWVRKKKSDVYPSRKLSACLLSFPPHPPFFCPGVLDFEFSCRRDLAPKSEKKNTTGPALVWASSARQSLETTAKDGQGAERGNLEATMGSGGTQTPFGSLASFLLTSSSKKKQDGHVSYFGIL